MSWDPFENEGNFLEDLGRFEAAAHPQTVEIDLPSIRNVAYVEDGSNQDATVRACGHILERQCQVGLKKLHGAASASQLLEMCRDEACDILAVPVPFGQDYDARAGESLGLFADQLLIESEIPLLMIRDHFGESALETTMRDILVPMAIHEPCVLRALSWSFRLLKEVRGRLRLLAVADEAIIDEAKHWFSAQDSETFQTESIERAMVREFGGLASACQRRSIAQGTSVRMETYRGEFQSAVLSGQGAHPQLIVVGRRRSHSAPSFHRAWDLVLDSRVPVLIV